MFLQISKSVILIFILFSSVSCNLQTFGNSISTAFYELSKDFSVFASLSVYSRNFYSSTLAWPSLEDIESEEFQNLDSNSVKITIDSVLILNKSELKIYFSNFCPLYHLSNVDFVPIEQGYLRVYNSDKNEDDVIGEAFSIEKQFFFFEFEKKFLTITMKD